MRYTNRRRKLVEYFGGKCERCGYNKSVRALHFHHKDPSDKKNWRGSGSRTGPVSNNEVEQHPERFMLVCANCHAEIHDEETGKELVYTTCEFCGKRFRTQPHRGKSRRDRHCSRECVYGARDNYAKSNQSAIDRLWKHTVKTETCWEWQADLFNEKYPYFSQKQDNGKYTIRLAHRISYELHVGPIPPRKQLVRTCGNIRCVNPDHLAIR